MADRAGGVGRQGGALAGAVGSEQTEDFAGPDVQRERIDRDEAAVVKGDLAKRQDAGHDAETPARRRDGDPLIAAGRAECKGKCVAQREPEEPATEASLSPCSAHLTVGPLLPHAPGTHGAGRFAKNASSPCRHSSVRRGAADAFAASSMESDWCEKRCSKSFVRARASGPPSASDRAHVSACSRSRSAGTTALRKPAAFASS